MGFLDWLTGKIECPRCGTRGAKKINGRIHCPNPTCAYFSKTMGKSDAAPERPNYVWSIRPKCLTGSIAIQYRNFRGQGKTFVAEAASARRSQEPYQCEGSAPGCAHRPFARPHSEPE